MTIDLTELNDQVMHAAVLTHWVLAPSGPFTRNGNLGDNVIATTELALAGLIAVEQSTRPNTSSITPFNAHIQTDTYRRINTALSLAAQAAQATRFTTRWGGNIQFGDHVELGGNIDRMNDIGLPELLVGHFINGNSVDGVVEQSMPNYDDPTWAVRFNLDGHTYDVYAENLVVLE